jgi:hypothetical protein
MATDETHSCPGGCGARVPHHQFSCKPCWFRLPKPYRDAIDNGYRQRRTSPLPHRQAMRAAVLWYRDNPGVTGRG